MPRGNCSIDSNVEATLLETHHRRNAGKARGQEGSRVALQGILPDPLERLVNGMGQTDFRQKGPYLKKLG